MNRKILSAALAAALALGSFILSSAGTVTPQPSAPATVKAVLAARVLRSDQGPALRLHGVTRAARRAVLAFTVGGRVRRRPVRVGDSVRQGQVLASLDRRQLANSVAATAAALGQVTAQLSQAQRELARGRSLNRSGALPSQALEQAQTRQQVLRARQQMTRVKLKEARRVLSEATLRAPFAGIISAVLVQPGELVAPGRPVVAVAGARQLEVQVEAPESVVFQLKRGQPVTVDLPLTGRSGIPGTIKSLGLAAGGPGQLFPLVVALTDAARVRPGMTAEVVARQAARPDLVVPTAAVMNPSGTSPSLFVVRQGRVRRLTVTLGSLRGDRVAVRGPLRVDEQAVVGGHAALVDGDRVRVVGVTP